MAEYPLAGRHFTYPPPNVSPESFAKTCFKVQDPTTLYNLITQWYSNVADFKNLDERHLISLKKKNEIAAYPGIREMYVHNFKNGLYPCHPSLLFAPFVGYDKKVDSLLLPTIRFYMDKPFYGEKTGRWYFPDGNSDTSLFKAGQAQLVVNPIDLVDRAIHVYGSAVDPKVYRARLELLTPPEDLGELFKEPETVRYARTEAPASRIKRDAEPDDITDLADFFQEPPNPFTVQRSLTLRKPVPIEQPVPRAASPTPSQDDFYSMKTPRTMRFEIPGTRDVVERLVQPEFTKKKHKKHKPPKVTELSRPSERAGKPVKKKKFGFQLKRRRTIPLQSSAAMHRVEGTEKKSDEDEQGSVAWFGELDDMKRNFPNLYKLYMLGFTSQALVNYRKIRPVLKAKVEEITPVPLNSSTATVSQLVKPKMSRKEAIPYLARELDTLPAMKLETARLTNPPKKVKKVPILYKARISTEDRQIPMTMEAVRYPPARKSLVKRIPVKRVRDPWLFRERRKSEKGFEEMDISDDDSGDDDVDIGTDQNLDLLLVPAMQKLRLDEPLNLAGVTRANVDEQDSFRMPVTIPPPKTVLHSQFKRPLKPFIAKRVSVDRDYASNPLARSSLPSMLPQLGSDTAQIADPLRLSGLFRSVRSMKRVQKRKIIRDIVSRLLQYARESGDNFFASEKYRELQRQEIKANPGLQLLAITGDVDQIATAILRQVDNMTDAERDRIWLSLSKLTDMDIVRAERVWDAIRPYLSKPTISTQLVSGFGKFKN